MRKTISGRDYVRWLGVIAGVALIIFGAFKPMTFSVGAQAIDCKSFLSQLSGYNALMISGLTLILVVMIGVQIAKYFAAKAGAKGE
jgi:hypothetical protein